jgi:hypothetical protein
MNAGIIVVALALATGAISVAAAAGQDVKISLKQLPPAVRQAADQNLLGGVIRGASKEIEKGQTFYEIETLRSGHARDLLFDTDGRLVAVEEVLALDAVPPAVRAALTAKGKVLKVESVTKGTDVTYEAVVQRDGKKVDLLVDGAGKPLQP